jgi:tetratricopeptide (TPR) repeat protein
MAGSYDKAARLYELSRFTDVERELLDLLRDEAQNACAHSLLSQARLALGRKDDALASAKQAVVLQPDSAHGYYALSHAFYSLDMQVNALRAIQEAIRIDPNNADYHCLLACFRSNTFDWSGMLEASNNGLQHDPHHLNCLEQRFQALQQLGRTAESHQTATQIVENAPDKALAHKSLAAYYLETNQPDLAHEHYLEARRLDPMGWQATEDVLLARGRQNFLMRFAFRVLPSWSRWSPKQRWWYSLSIYALYIALLWLGGLFPEGKAASRPSIWDKDTVLWDQGNPPLISKLASILAVTSLQVVALPWWLTVIAILIADIAESKGRKNLRELLVRLGIMLMAVVFSVAFLTYWALMPGRYSFIVMIGMLTGNLAYIRGEIGMLPKLAIAYLAILALAFLLLIAGTNSSSMGFKTIAVAGFCVISFVSDDVARWAYKSSGKIGQL